VAEFEVYDSFQNSDPRPESYVFQSSRGNMVGAQWYTDAFNRALKKAGITDYVRPFHDMRHTALTNEAATGKSNPIALMTKAGHRSFKTTQEYIKLAGTVFPDEAEALEARLTHNENHPEPVPESVPVDS